MMYIRNRGDFRRVTEWLNRMKTKAKVTCLDKFGQRGVEALRASTPTDTGKTAASWYYEVKQGDGFTSITFNNSNINDGVPIAIILQYGHGTRTGGWVQGRDYINPAIQPIFDQMADEAWKEVVS